MPTSFAGERVSRRWQSSVECAIDVSLHLFTGLIWMALFDSSQNREMIVAIAPSQLRDADAERQASASRVLSVSSCRTTRQRPAPMVRRIAISRRLTVALARNRLATLPQAMSQTSPDAQSASIAIRRTCGRLFLCRACSSATTSSLGGFTWLRMLVRCVCGYEECSRMVRDELSVMSAFLTVADERSFTKAAKRLGVTQSALSHAIRGLEGQVGVRLLARTTRSVAPTKAGERLLAELRPALTGIRGALDRIGRLRDGANARAGGAPRGVGGGEPGLSPVRPPCRAPAMMSPTTSRDRFAAPTNTPPVNAGS
jgi:hypothetical protein